MRNKVQHLNNEIKNLATQVSPAWGVVTWFTVIDKEPLTVRVGWMMSGAVSLYGKPTVVMPDLNQVTHKINLVSLDAHGLTLSLTDTMAAVQQITRALEKTFVEQIKEFEEQHGEIITVASDAMLLVDFAVDAGVQKE